MDPYESSKKRTKRYKKIKKLMKILYHYDNFKPKQYEIINQIINGRDVCAILPTGYGKSLTYQIPALYLDKPAIIVSPLISLMDDQCLMLKEMGITSCCYNSNVSDKQKMKTEILQHKYKFIYITPEAIVRMQDFIKKLNREIGISLIAIDEAHCISSYGFDFRKPYRELSFVKEILPNTPVLAVTATATNTVCKDIFKVLGLKNYKFLKSSFDRPNLYLQVQQKSKPETDIIPLIKKYADASIIIYCLKKKETEKMAALLETYGIKCGVYHGGLDNHTKNTSHVQFIKGKIKVIAATIAFGMGINKSDVRVVIHYGCPKNIEGYYQEIGRAGRDGRDAFCHTFYNYGDFKLQERFISDITDATFKNTRIKLLEIMKNYITTKQCRRKMLLEYFGEEYRVNCKNCDNCRGVNQDYLKMENKPLQHVNNEAKMLINLIEAMNHKNFGIMTYINILRGSKNKKITEEIRKNEYYNRGKHRSILWWKEMIDNLISQKFLQLTFLNRNGQKYQVLKTTKQGILWCNLAEFGGLVNTSEIIELQPMKMTNTL